MSAEIERLHSEIKYHVSEASKKEEAARETKLQYDTLRSVLGEVQQSLKKAQEQLEEKESELNQTRFDLEDSRKFILQAESDMKTYVEQKILLETELASLREELLEAKSSKVVHELQQVILAFFSAECQAM